MYLVSRWWLARVAWCAMSKNLSPRHRRSSFCGFSASAAFPCFVRLSPMTTTTTTTSFGLHNVFAWCNISLFPRFFPTL
uniref:Putative secreted peptide n=1 Tax=Anopheles braziliensis TaxID=58242 RepID=A0A2M3ZVY4_9DIPT